jgi:hypothetical protein
MTSQLSQVALESSWLTTLGTISAAMLRKFNQAQTVGRNVIAPLFYLLFLIFAIAV